MGMTIRSSIATDINYAASHQRKQTIVGTVFVEQATAGNYVLRIYAEPEFFFECRKVFTVTESTATVPVPEITFNDAFYRTNLIEAQEGQIKIEISASDAPDSVLGFLYTNVHIQPYLHWDGAHFPETLPGFMQPNDPLVQLVMKKAGEYAAAEGNMMSGYQCRSREGVRKQAGYIYKALQDMDIHYLSAPASFETYGQKIRIPHQVLHEGSRQGTCLDLAVIFATCLEAASLHAVIVVIIGHAFAGVWLESSKVFSKPLVRKTEVGEENWKQAAADILPVECTTFTDGRGVDFATAMSIGQKNMPECRYLCDVEATRRAGFSPVYTYTDEPICEEPEQDGKTVSPELPEDGENDFDREEFSREERNRIEQLRDSAMDLTVKSHLLNSTADSLSISFTLNAEEFMQMHSAPSRNKTADMSSIIMERIEGRLSTGKKASSGKSNAKKNVLRELYSKSLQNTRERGKSNLYIAMNELVWKRDSGRSCNAVMYLCPAEIYRNRRGELHVRLTTQDMIFNPALKVLLNHKYHFDSAKILDQPGEKYREQIQYLEYLIENQKGWAVREDVARLALYSVPNESVWNGLSDRSVAAHEIVNGILNGEMSWDNSAEDHLPQEEESRIYAFESDSSQDQIIESAFTQKAQVVVGPAGNGKTQTVVNIMAEAVRRGQKVLFISEKTTALEVAFSKLNEILKELFSLKIVYGRDRREDVVRQIKGSLDFLETHRDSLQSESITAAKTKHAEYLAYLNQYYRYIGEKSFCGKTLSSLINMYEAYDKNLPLYQLDESILQIPLTESEDTIGVFARLLEQCEHERGSYAEFIRYDNLEGNREQETLIIAQQALNRYELFADLTGEFQRFIGFEAAENPKKQMSQVMFAAEILGKCPVIDRNIEDLRQELKVKEDTYIEEVIDELQMLHGLRILPGGKSRQEKCLELLREEFSIEESQCILENYRINPNETSAKLRQDGISGTGGRNSSEDRKLVRKYDSYIKKVKASLRGEEESFRTAICRAIERIVKGQGNDILERAEEVVLSYNEYVEAQKKADTRIVVNISEFQKQYPDTPRKVLYEEWIKNHMIDASRSRNIYDSFTADMREKGYGNFIHQIEDANADGRLTAQEIRESFYKSWAFEQIRKMQKEDAEGRTFNNYIFQDRIERLNRTESEIRRYQRREILDAQIDRMPDIRQGVRNNPELGILQRLIRQKKTPIRAFFQQAPNMIQLLCPCILMDPSAVAEYIPSDFPAFDLVIIDEGSQMPAYNALIPIAHGKRCIIFGDEKQLQPGDRFRMRREDEEYEEDSSRESILTAAYITSMPRNMLRFHYRSENESLIAFSNNFYYHGDITTFPSAETDIRGVSYELVSDGFYDHKSKTNRTEAEYVVGRIREIFEQMDDDAEQTLGIITLNIHQRDLIQKLLLEEIQEDSDLGRKTDELVSVVNLESCQGREWDYVIISPGFGNDKDGKFHFGFGALNQEFGANRLNVMLTRARRQMFVMTSIEPHMLTGARSEGVKDFKEFLQFARGDLVLDSRRRDSSARMPGLINSVADALEKEGYEVHTNIGSSDFKVDLGIVSKENPDRYALGILTDHSANCKTDIHDREVVYPRILESKGWKIYRLCGLNWFSDMCQELSQIRKYMEE